MDKTDFFSRISKQFQHILSAHERHTTKEILGMKSRTDTEGFRKWLSDQHEKAANDPALRTYDRVLRVSMDTPEKAAQSLTDLINFDLDGTVQWREQFDNAAPILTNWQPERSEGWKYRGNFLAYLNGAKSDMRARVFARFLQMPQPGIDIPGIVADTLENYPAIKVLQTNFEDMLFLDYSRNLETIRVSGTAFLEAEIIKWLENCRMVFKGWQNTPPANYPPGHVDENKANMEITIRFHEAMLRQIGAGSEKAKGRKPSAPRTFEMLFKGIAEMNRFLTAVRDAGLIASDGTGYVWVEARHKTQRICAMWAAAKDAGYIGGKVKNNNAIAMSIKAFFKMDSLSNSALDEANPFHEEYKRTKGEIEKQLKLLKY